MELGPAVAVIVEASVVGAEVVGAAVVEVTAVVAAAAGVIAPNGVGNLAVMVASSILSLA